MTTLTGPTAIAYVRAHGLTTVDVWTRDIVGRLRHSQPFASVPARAREYLETLGLITERTSGQIEATTRARGLPPAADPSPRPTRKNAALTGPRTMRNDSITDTDIAAYLGRFTIRLREFGANPEISYDGEGWTARVDLQPADKRKRPLRVASFAESPGAAVSEMRRAATCYRVSWGELPESALD